MPRVKSGRRTPNELRASQRWERDPLAARVMRDLAVRAYVRTGGSRISWFADGCRADRDAFCEAARGVGQGCPLWARSARVDTTGEATLEPLRDAGARGSSRECGRVGQVASKVYLRTGAGDRWLLLSSKLSPLTLEKALGRLLGLIGSRVEISIYSEEPRGLLASFEGELAAGNELARPAGRAHDEAFVFRLAGEAAPRFVLESRMLRRACVVATPEDEAHSLRFYLGVTTVLQVNPL